MIGSAARPVTTPGKNCECVPPGEEKCGFSTTSRSGATTYYWAYKNSCSFGKCDAGKTCQSGTQPNGDPMCECK